MQQHILRLFALCFLAMSYSCKQQSYYAKNDYSRVQKIDVHTHIFKMHSAMCEQAVAGNFYMLDVNLEDPDILSIPSQGQISKFLMTTYPKRIGWITTFSTEGFDKPQWTTNTINVLKKDFQNGAIGIKIWKNIGMTLLDSNKNFVMIDDPRFDSVINFVVRSGKTVVGHLGEPKDCWLPIDSMVVINDREYYSQYKQYHMYLHPEYPSYEKQITARDHFLLRHPDMLFVGAHLASLEWSVDELSKRLDYFPNVAVDLTERLSHLQYQSQKDYSKVRNFFIKYQDRILYGSDLSLYPNDSNYAAIKEHMHSIWKQEWDYLVSADSLQSARVIGKFKGMHLPREVVDKIFYSNATKWYKWSP